MCMRPIWPDPVRAAWQSLVNLMTRGVLGSNLQTWFFFVCLFVNVRWWCDALRRLLWRKSQSGLLGNLQSRPLISFTHLPQGRGRSSSRRVDLLSALTGALREDNVSKTACWELEAIFNILFCFNVLQCFMLQPCTNVNLYENSDPKLLLMLDLGIFWYSSLQILSGSVRMDRGTFSALDN